MTVGQVGGGDERNMLEIPAERGLTSRVKAVARAFSERNALSLEMPYVCLEAAPGHPIKG